MRTYGGSKSLVDRRTMPFIFGFIGKHCRPQPLLFLMSLLMQWLSIRGSFNFPLGPTLFTFRTNGTLTGSGYLYLTKSRQRNWMLLFKNGRWNGAPR